MEADAGFIGVNRSGCNKKIKRRPHRPSRDGHYEQPDYGGVYLARAAQQRKQLRAQRQTREQRACEGKK